MCTDERVEVIQRTVQYMFPREKALRQKTYSF